MTYADARMLAHGTACHTSPTGPIVLGLQVQPSLIERLDAAQEFVVPGQAPGICRLWGLADNFDTSSDRYQQSAPAIQDALLQLDRARSVKADQQQALIGIVGDVQQKWNRDGRALLHIHPDPESVFAQTVLEANAELQGKPWRPCEVCAQPIPDKYRSHRLTCSEGCRRVRKRKAERDAYRRKAHRPVGL